MLSLKKQNHFYLERVTFVFILCNLFLPTCHTDTCLSGILCGGYSSILEYIHACQQLLSSALWACSSLHSHPHLTQERYFMSFTTLNSAHEHLGNEFFSTGVWHRWSTGCLRSQEPMRVKLHTHNSVFINNRCATCSPLTLRILLVPFSILNE